jgi:pimeloyl-ACP methyl ester carboxylesterase
MARWLGLLRGFEHRLHLAHPVLVGHSLGAGVAAAAGLARPHDVSGVVLLDGDALALAATTAGSPTYSSTRTTPPSTE